MSRFICFDLEGPLSPQDNAYELMNLFPHGGRVFQAISRYDDLLTLEGREGYEPGDTLALIVPFLLYHDIREDRIQELAQKACLVNGARDLVSYLRFEGWDVFCISTSYEQYARNITRRVGIEWENVACTSFPPHSYHQSLAGESLARIGNIESEILALRPEEDDERLKVLLDHFYWVELPDTTVSRVMREVKPVGGRRKVEALQRFAVKYRRPVERFVVVGDSITDFRMLEVVNQAGGLAVAFNANEYALPYANIGLASTHLSDLAPVLEAWAEGGREAAERVVKQKEEAGGVGDRGHFHWLAGGRELGPVLEIHHRIRHLVREEAGKLG